MLLPQSLQHMLKEELITLKEPPQNPNTSSPRNNPNAWCTYHSNSRRYDTNNCWALKNKIQDMIDSKEIEFDPPETPNVITSPIPNHDKGINAIDDVSYVSVVSDLTTPLMIVKKNRLQASLFPDCIENCYHYTSQSNGCMWLKKGIHCLMDDHVILIEKTPSMENLCESVSQDLGLKDVLVIIISNTSLRITYKGHVEINAEPRVAPLIITASGPVPYSDD